MLTPLRSFPLSLFPCPLLLCDFYVNRERKFPKVCCACGTLPVPTHVSLTACSIAAKEKIGEGEGGGEERDRERQKTFPSCVDRIVSVP